jgi:hypothetical protein
VADGLRILRDEQFNEREFARFLGYSLASTSELENHFIVARDVRATTTADFDSALAQLIDVRKMLHGLRRRVSQARNLRQKELSRRLQRLANSDRRGAGGSVVKNDQQDPRSGYGQTTVLGTHTARNPPRIRPASGKVMLTSPSIVLSELTELTIA